MHEQITSRSAWWIAFFAMLLAAAIWGFAFTPQKIAAEHLGAFSLSAIRFLLGAGVVYLFRAVSARRLGFTREEITRGGFLGVVLAVAAVLQQIGVETTTAGKAGFITGLYIVFVPLLLRIFWKEPTAAQLWLGVGLSVAGLYLLSVSQELQMVTGDLYVLLCAVVFALHIVLTGFYAPKIDPVSLAIVQALSCSIVCWILALLLETPTPERALAAWRSIFYLGVLSVGIAYTIQVVVQRYLSAVLVGFIASLEAVFAVWGGSLFLGESLTQRQVWGCVLMMAGIVLAQIPTKSPLLQKE